MKLNLSLLPHQAQFLTDSTTRNLALCGGYGAGKTKALAYKLITLALQNPGYEGAMLSPTYGMSKKVAIPTLEETLREHEVPYQFNKSALTFDISVRGRTTRVHTLAAETFKRAAGLNLAFFGVDEADLIAPDAARAAWQMLSSRLRRGLTYQGVAVSTPEGYGFLWQYFVDEVNQKPDLAATRRIIHARTYDNPFLPPSYITELEEQYPPHLIKAYLHGEFVNLTGTAVWYGYDAVASATPRTLATFDPAAVLHIGVDFNVGVMAATVAVVEGGTAYFIAEHTGARNTEALIAELKLTYPQRHLIVYPDASGANNSANASLSSIALLQRAGFEVKAHRANPRVKDRVAAFNARLCGAKQERRVLINATTCPKLSRALLQQAYGKDGTPDKTAGHDHLTDAASYFIEFCYPLRPGGSYSVAG